MRVTTGMIYDSGVGQMQRQNAQLLDTQKQVATGRRILRPSDDPVASARALEISQSKSVNNLYAANQGYASDALKLVDSKLDAANEIVTYVRTRAVESGNGVYTASEQASIGADLAEQFSALLGIANSQDSTGEYVFGGYSSNIQPFTGGLAGGVGYQGDQGERTLQISASRNLPITSSGDEIFNAIRAPAGSAFALAGAGNTGAAQVSGSSLSAAYNGHSYAVSVGAGPTYQVFDSTADPAHASPIAPTVTTSGTSTTLAFGGVSLTLSGAPASGDSFSVSTVSSTFDVLGNFVNALKSGNAAAIRFNGTQTIAGMDASQENVSRVRSGVGSRMVEVETQQNINGNLDLQFNEALSRLEDVDYAEAVSNLTQQRTFLQAAQQSFLKVSNLSLFNYLG
ncbi:flagellar hook-associated protein FlgL [Zoogloea sp.]|uniref:flagellar hook-associated protein FlgL n=1 Tax=Zoogloea sp. TaxID=49181 RepID=UPI0035B4CCA9